MAFRCKRIIDGKTYNTETATRIAGWDEPDGSFVSGNYLFQNRFGVFFVYSYGDGAAEDDYEIIRPLSPEEARSWIEEKIPYEVDLIERLFGAMPEAGSGEVKYTLRMPESLRDRLASLAKANGQSLNAWVIRCLEACSTPNARQGDS